MVEYAQDESVGAVSDVDESTSEESASASASASASYSSATPENHGMFLLPASFFYTNITPIQYCMVCLLSCLYLFQKS